MDLETVEFTLRHYPCRWHQALWTTVRAAGGRKQHRQPPPQSPCSIRNISPNVFEDSAYCNFQHVLKHLEHDLKRS